MTLGIERQITKYVYFQESQITFYEILVTRKFVWLVSKFVRLRANVGLSSPFVNTLFCYDLGKFQNHFPVVSDRLGSVYHLRFALQNSAININTQEERNNNSNSNNTTTTKTTTEKKKKTRKPNKQQHKNSEQQWKK